MTCFDLLHDRVSNEYRLITRSVYYHQVINKVKFIVLTFYINIITFYICYTLLPV